MQRISAVAAILAVAALSFYAAPVVHAKSCSEMAADCKGTTKQCKAALASCKRTGIFVGTVSGKRWPATSRD